VRLYQAIILYAAIVLEALLLTGLVLRRHVSACLTFPLYLAAVLIPDWLFVQWPARYYTWENYLLKEMVHNLLKFAIAAELAYRTFGPFQGALGTARRVFLILLVVIAVITLLAPAPARNPGDIDIEWHARMLNGTIWIFTAIAAMILWYRLPVEPLHKAILLGFVPYLLVFSLGMRALVDMGWTEARRYQRFHTLAYICLLLYWNRVAWSRAAVPVSGESELAREPGLA
jgi:hypothetical protein